MGAVGRLASVQGAVFADQSCDKHVHSLDSRLPSALQSQPQLCIELGRPVDEPVALSGEVLNSDVNQPHSLGHREACRPGTLCKEPGGRADEPVVLSGALCDSVFEQPPVADLQEISVPCTPVTEPCILSDNSVLFGAGGQGFNQFLCSSILPSFGSSFARHSQHCEFCASPLAVAGNVSLQGWHNSDLAVCNSCVGQVVTATRCMGSPHAEPSNVQRWFSLQGLGAVLKSEGSQQDCIALHCASCLVPVAVPMTAQDPSLQPLCQHCCAARPRASTRQVVLRDPYVSGQPVLEIFRVIPGSAHTRQSMLCGTVCGQSFAFPNPCAPSVPEGPNPNFHELAPCLHSGQPVHRAFRVSHGCDRSLAPGLCRNAWVRVFPGLRPSRPEVLPLGFSLGPNPCVSLNFTGPRPTFEQRWPALNHHHLVSSDDDQMSRCPSEGTGSDCDQFLAGPRPCACGRGCALGSLPLPEVQAFERACVSVSELKFVWRCISCTTFASGVSLPGMLKPTRVGLCVMAVLRLGCRGQGFSGLSSLFLMMRTLWSLGLGLI